MNTPLPTFLSLRLSQSVRRDANLQNWAFESCLSVSLKVNLAHMISYWRFTVIMGVSRMVSDIGGAVCQKMQICPESPVFNAPVQKVTVSVTVL